MEKKDENLEKLIEKLNICNKKIDGIGNKKTKSLEESRNKIESEFAGKLNPFYEERKKINDSINEYIKDYEKYSTFDNEILGKILSELLTMYEGKKFCYQKASFHTTKITPCVFDRIEEDVTYHIRVCVNERKKRNFYNGKGEFDDIRMLVNDNDMLILDESENWLGKNITVNKHTGKEISSCINFGRFVYVKDFLNYVIKQRIENGIEQVDYGYMEDLLRKFILLRRGAIESGYNARFQEQMNLYQEQLEKDIADYAKSLDTFLNNK